MFDIIEPSSSLFLIFVAIIGLIFGSFLNVVITRFPKMLKKEWYIQCKVFLSDKHDIHLTPDDSLNQAPFNLIRPRSQCCQCKKTVKAQDNIPLLSYCILKGKCRHCQCHIPLRYPFVEFLTAVLSAFCAHHFGFTFSLIPVLLLTWGLIALSFIDLDEQILPDDITLPLLWLGLLVNINSTFCTLPQAVLGAALGYFILWLVYWVFKLITGKEGMGYGDFKLLAMLGAWVGVAGLLPIILIASFSGAIFGITAILLKRHEKGQPLPFGPFLACAGWLVLLYGDKMVHYYFSLTSITTTL